MPGIGVLPIGMLTAFTEIPGGKFPGGNGFAESPGGMFAGSSLISRLAGMFELTFAFDGEFDPQPKPVITMMSKKRVFFNIRFKINVPV